MRAGLNVELAAGNRGMRQGLVDIITQMDAGIVARATKSSSDRSRAIIGGDSNRPLADALANRQRTLLQQNDDPALAQLRLERILQGNELTDINYLAQGLACAKSVCRIVLRSQGRLLGYGTGFLVAPGVVLTNHHVLSSIELVSEAVAQFRYERTIAGAEATSIGFKLETTPSPILSQELDFALAAVGSPTSLSGNSAPTETGPNLLDEFGWLYLNPQPGKAFIGEHLTIIQHPNGERKQLCVRENRLLKYDENGPYVWYQTDTVGGSSGSPVFNNSWEVVALHHSGVPRTEVRDGRTVYLTKDNRVWTNDMGSDELDWIANEGIRVSKILKYLESSHGNHPLANKALKATMPAWSEASPAANVGSQALRGSGVQISNDGKGTTRIWVPIEIGVRVPLSSEPERTANILQSPAATTAQPISIAPQLSAPMVSLASTNELVTIDTSNYDERNGYDPEFLGKGSLAVPLPTLSVKAKPSMLKISGTSGELKYWNYSVVIHKKRGLTFFSAANIDPALGKGNRAGDGWIRDERVDKLDRKSQIGNEFYEKQSTFEAEDRSKNPFDKGHLTRREDLQWGRTEKLAKRNGDDSFHFPNCAPQHFEFNQARKVNGIWNRLEQMTTEIAGDGATFCVFNGPVFDAPTCVQGDDGKLHLNLRGKGKVDLQFGGVAIPKLFFKVIVWPEKAKLRVAAFVVTQEDLLVKLDRLRQAKEVTRFEAGLNEDEVRLYQVQLSDLEHVTQMSFGKLTKLPAPAMEESTLTPGLNAPIASEEEIRFVLD